MVSFSGELAGGGREKLGKGLLCHGHAWEAEAEMCCHGVGEKNKEVSIPMNSKTGVQAIAITVVPIVRSEKLIQVTSRLIRVVRTVVFRSSTMVVRGRTARNKTILTPATTDIRK